MTAVNVDAQDVVAQIVEPTCTVREAAPSPKLSPDSVRLSPDVDAEFSSPTKLTTGASSRS